MNLVDVSVTGSGVEVTVVSIVVQLVETAGVDVDVVV